MNRHRAYWSAMGIEPEGTAGEKSLRERIEILIGRYGLDAVVTEVVKKLQQHQESSRHSCREESEVRNED